MASSSLGASTAFFAAEILGNHLISLSLAARSSSSIPAAALFKPMAISSSKKKKAAPAKAKPVAAMIWANQEQKKCQNNDSGATYEPEAGWSSDWILDSGASNHACLNKEWFDTFEETYGEALMGDDTMCRVTGVGTVKVKMFDGIVRTLGDVRYIPALKQNIISLGRLDSLGYGFESSKGELKVTKGSKVYMKGDLTSYNVYRLQGVTMVGKAAGSTQEDSKDTSTHTTIDRKSKSIMKKRSKSLRHQF